MSSPFAYLRAWSHCKIVRVVITQLRLSAMRLVWGFWNYMLSVPQPSVGRLTYLAGSTKVYRTTEDLGPSMLALGSRDIFDGVNKRACEPLPRMRIQVTHICGVKPSWRFEYQVPRFPRGRSERGSFSSLKLEISLVSKECARHMPSVVNLLVLFGDCVFHII